MPESKTGPDGREAPTVSPFELLTVLWRRKLIVIGVVVVSVVVALGLSLRSQKQYSASAQIEFRDPGFAQALFGNGLFQAGQDAQRTAQTNIDVVTSGNVVTQALLLLHSHESAGSLLSSVVVSPNQNADVATIKATRSTPREAARVANAFAEGYIIYRRQTDQGAVSQAENLLNQSLVTASAAEQTRIQASLRQLNVLKALQTGNADVVARAEPDGTPVSPKPKRDATLGLVLGLLLGSGLALLADVLDRRLKTVEDFEQAYAGYPVIGTIPASSALEPQRLGPTAESYRMLREGLRFIDPTGLARCFVITSADESEGKSTVAVNLASSLEAVGQRVLLLEADMRRPTAAVRFGIPKSTLGLSDLLVSRGDLEEYLVTPEDEPNLVVLPSGTIPPNSADLLRVGRMSEILSAARQSADVVIIDSPPLLPVADTRVLLQMPEVDGLILVARVGTTRRDRARTARRLLEQSEQRVFGLVVTGVTGAVGSSYYYDQRPDTAGRWRAGRDTSSV